MYDKRKHLLAVFYHSMVYFLYHIKIECNIRQRLNMGAEVKGKSWSFSRIFTKCSEMILFKITMSCLTKKILPCVLFEENKGYTTNFMSVHNCQQLKSTQYRPLHLYMYYAFKGINPCTSFVGIFLDYKKSILSPVAKSSLLEKNPLNITLLVLL